MPGLGAKDKYTHLGVKLSRSGNQKHQLHIALEIIGEGSRISLGNSFTNYHAYLYITYHPTPKLLHSFVSVSFSLKQYKHIELKINPHTITNMGFNRMLPLILGY